MLKGVDFPPIFAIAFTLGISFIAVFLGVLLNNARLGDLTGRLGETKELLRAEIKAVAAELRLEIQSSAAEIRADVVQLRVEVRGDVKDLRSELTLFKQVMDARLDRLETMLERHHSELVVRISDLENARRS